MLRCLDLAEKGLGNVAPNPMVGAVLVYENRIIGEGYHEYYGGPHAEVNCISSVQSKDRNLIASSTLYVSLEPCCHYGKTPPCSELIIREGIKKVVIACPDPFEKVSGGGVSMLKQAGIEVVLGCLEKEARFLNRRFFSFCRHRRPWIILKWAQSFNGKINQTGVERKKISEPLTDRLVHRWRSEEQAIMVGTRTALEDNPILNTRLWAGKNPLRISIDRRGFFPEYLNLLDGTIPTLIFGPNKKERKNLSYIPLDGDDFFRQFDQIMVSMGILSVLVEGGPILQQSFVDAGRWDEARIITNQGLIIEEGRDAILKPENSILLKQERIGKDTIDYLTNKHHY
jgi:diaminohydroxyphosphoribosylaminopyrimidine deaminase/5-amino-6-(5-phosphoribosylamino)uracil reductase